MRVRTCDALLLAALAVAMPLVAQAAGGVVITSSPPGAVVELRGDHVISGITPWRLDRGMTGLFEVWASKPGYADWHGSMSLSGTRMDSLHIRLNRRSPLSTGLRSAIVPGWGQFHAEENLRGTLFFLAEAGAVAGFLYTHDKRDDAQAVYDKAQRDYRNATEIEELEAARAARDDAFYELEKWHDRRRNWIYAAAAVWLVNVVDAAVLIPAERGGGFFAGLPFEQEPGPFVGLDADKATLGYSLSF